ncbi:hypothetical protein COV18_01205 [Candidatus Woesearchaeota archaeon CG10_big_fil_rev_8_21_14_0_10_37_12]|nr:MAG: hypothetical protein COV18_01205 [Candidatus Woesearchaeota archaeon CG10_big_fil_rev_8_21_14_0_10_37_12]
MDKKKALIGLFFAFIMVSSVFGFVAYYTSPTASDLVYGEFSFRPITQNGVQQYITEINNQDYGFLFFPGDLDYVDVSDETKALLNAPIYTITYDDASSLADFFGDVQYSLEFRLADQKLIERAVTSENSSLPMRTCVNATEYQPVIQLQEANESSISASNNCILVSAVDAYDLYRQSERLLYVILGVME